MSVSEVCTHWWCGERNDSSFLVKTRCRIAWLSILGIVIMLGLSYPVGLLLRYGNVKPCDSLCIEMTGLSFIVIMVLPSIAMLTMIVIGSYFFIDFCWGECREEYYKSGNPGQGYQQI